MLHAFPMSEHTERKVIVFFCRKQAPWDPEILRAVKARDHSAVLYAARPATMRANQVPYELKESRIKKNASFVTSSTGHNGTHSQCFQLGYTQDIGYVV